MISKKMEEALNKQINANFTHRIYIFQWPQILKRKILRGLPSG